MFYRIDVDQWDASKASHQRDKLVEVIGSSPRDDCAQDDHAETEEVLLPLDPWVILACPAEELLAGDLNGWVDL